MIRPVLTGVQLLLLGSCYLTTQGYYLLQNQVTARSMTRLQQTIPAGADLTPEQEMEQRLFRDVDRIREFGLSEVGLTAGKSFTTYVRTDRNYLVDVVSAARTDRFERKEWSFPVFGRFPYKGFYRPDAAERLAEQLRREGWDVYVRRVDAFSTLGFLREPLYTFMTAYDDARLADLILHEMAHATLWVKDEAQFNEEFAVFVGRAGAREYRVRRFGEDDQRVIDLDLRRVDAAAYREDILGLRDTLNVLYESSMELEDEYSRRERVLREKEAIIRRFQEEFRNTYDERYSTNAYRGAAEITINNAYLDLFSTYTGNLHLFEEYHRLLGGSLRHTVDALVLLITTRPAGERPTDTIRGTVENLRDISGAQDYTWIEPEKTDIISGVSI